MTPSSPLPPKFFWDCTKDENHFNQRSTKKHMTAFLLGEPPPAFKRRSGERLEAVKPPRQLRGLAADPSLFLQASLGSSHAVCRQTDSQTARRSDPQPASTPSCSSWGPRPPRDCARCLELGGPAWSETAWIPRFLGPAAGGRPLIYHIKKQKQQSRRKANRTGGFLTQLLTSEAKLGATRSPSLYR